MKISKETRFEPVTITLETENELMGLKNIVRYMESADNNRNSVGYYRAISRFNSLSDNGKKMYHSLKMGL